MSGEHEESLPFEVPTEEPPFEVPTEDYCLLRIDDAQQTMGVGAFGAHAHSRLKLVGRDEVIGEVNHEPDEGSLTGPSWN